MGRERLEALLERGGPGELLVLGEGDCFSPGEIARFLKRRGFEAVEELSDAVVAVLESRRLSPAAERLGERAYAAGIPHYPMEELERIVSASLRPKEVLMALKLGRDDERLLRLLGNEHLDDDFFLSLLRLYRWESDELMGSDRDRRVLIALMERFLKLSVYEQDAYHSPSTLLRLINATENPELLDALLDLPSFEFRLQRRERLSIPQAIARREILAPRTVERLLRLGDEKVDAFLAANPSVSPGILRQLHGRGDPELRRALAANPALPETLFEALLEEEGEVREILLHFQPVDLERLEKIEAALEEPELPAALGENGNLEPEVFRRLAEREHSALSAALASNPSLPPELLERLAARRELHPLLAANPSAPQGLLRRLYERGEAELLEALGANPSTPTEILEALYERGESALHRALAANPSTPMAILHQLKTDHSLWLILQHNETFVREANREMGMR